MKVLVLVLVVVGKYICTSQGVRCTRQARTHMKHTNLRCRTHMQWVPYATSPSPSSATTPNENSLE
jgi:hypothetical protein